jgi:hypothetical protein
MFPLRQKCLPRVSGECKGLSDAETLGGTWIEANLCASFQIW